MNYFVSYDIRDDRRRTRLSQLLLRRGGQRVQKSVFFIQDFDRPALEALLAAAARLLAASPHPADSLLCIPADREYQTGVTLLSVAGRQTGEILLDKRHTASL